LVGTLVTHFHRFTTPDQGTGREPVPLKLGYFYYEEEPAAIFGQAYSAKMRSG